MGIYINTYDNDDSISDILSESSLGYVNEVYFGKTKEILAIETQLDIFRNKYLGRYVLNMKVNSDKDLLKFDRMMEDYFGFGCFSLHIHNQQQANAFTMPVDYRYDYANPKDNIIADKNGFKFKKEFDYAAILGIYSGIIFNPDFSTQECMALILHEIGHNFNSAINRSNGTMVNMYISIIYSIDMILLLCGYLPSAISILSRSNGTRIIIEKTAKNMREKNYVPVVVYDAFKQFLYLIHAGIVAVNNLSRVLTLGLATVLGAASRLVTSIQTINPIQLIFKPFGLKIGYRSEESADNFATMYGYGGELSSALSKLEGEAGESSSRIMKVFNKIPVISQLTHLVEAPVEILMSIFDEHPNSAIRIQDQIALLNAELDKTDIDPKMRNTIKSDIKVCEDALQVLINTNNEINDPYIGRKFYNKILKDCKLKQKLLGDKFKFKEYDEVFKDVKR